MTDLRNSTLTIVLAGVLALTIAGCSSPASDPSTESTGGSSAEETTTDEPSTEESSSDSAEIEIVGGDLTSSTAVLLAETYAKGRDPQPTVEFLDATTVRFSFPEGLTEQQALDNCQIAYGALSGEGIRVLIAVGAAEADCTAEVEG